MIKVTAKQIFNSYNCLYKLSQERPSGQQKLLWDISRVWGIVKTLAEELAEKRKEIYKQYPHKEKALPNGDTTLTIDESEVTEEQKAQFKADIKELMGIEETIQRKPILFSDLEKSGIVLNADELAELSWLIVEKDES